MINKLLQFSKQELLVNENEIEIYKYGYFILIETVINVVVALIIAIALDAIRSFVLFSLFFIPLRIFAGGVHANSSFICIIISNEILIAAYNAVDYLCVINVERSCMILLTVLFSIIVLLLSPVDCKEKRIGKDDIRKIKIIVLVIALIEIALQACLSLNVVYIVMIVFLIEMISLFIGKIKNYNDNIM